MKFVLAAFLLSCAVVSLLVPKEPNRGQVDAIVEQGISHDARSHHNQVLSENVELIEGFYAEISREDPIPGFSDKLLGQMITRLKGERLGTVSFSLGNATVTRQLSLNKDNASLVRSFVRLESSSSRYFIDDELQIDEDNSKLSMTSLHTTHGTISRVSKFDRFGTLVLELISKHGPNGKPIDLW